VKFLVDAQLPNRLVALLKRAGNDAKHTIELPNGNRSTDREVAEIADVEGRVVATKDRDFRDGHLGLTSGCTCDLPPPASRLVPAAVERRLASGWRSGRTVRFRRMNGRTG
jgi:hypothetical protein